MRKTIAYIVCIVLAMTSVNVKGQDIGGMGFTVEYTANPFSSGSFLSPGFVRAKYLSGNLGFRLGLQASMTNSQPEPTTVEHVGFFDLRPGFEFHTGFGKASPYAGAEIILTNQSANRNSTTELGVANATSMYGANRGFFGFGAALVAGIDYYWGEKFYFGFEVGLDALNLRYKNVEMAGEVIIESTNHFDARTNFSNTLKMGFNF